MGMAGSVSKIAPSASSTTFCTVAAEADGRNGLQDCGPSERTCGDMPLAERLLQLPDKNIGFQPFVQDWYEGAPAVITANI